MTEQKIKTTTDFYAKQCENQCRELASDYYESVMKMTTDVNRLAMFEIALQDAYLAGVEDVLADAFKAADAQTNFSPPDGGAAIDVPVDRPGPAASAAPAAPRAGLTYKHGRKIS